MSWGEDGTEVCCEEIMRNTCLGFLECRESFRKLKRNGNIESKIKASLECSNKLRCLAVFFYSSLSFVLF